MATFEMPDLVQTITHNFPDNFSASWDETGTTWEVDETTGILTLTFALKPEQIEEGQTVPDSEQLRISDDGSMIYSFTFDEDADGVQRNIDISSVILTRKK